MQKNLRDGIHFLSIDSFDPALLQDYVNYKKYWHILKSSKQYETIY